MLVKIAFEIAPDDYEWAGRGTERLWAIASPDGYRIDNSPWYVRGIAWGDMVAASGDVQHLKFNKVLSRSGYSTVWIQRFSDDAAGKMERSLIEEMKSLGVSYEGDGAGVYSLSVPPTTSKPQLGEILLRGKDLEVWRYQIAHDGGKSL